MSRIYWCNNCYEPRSGPARCLICNHKPIIREEPPTERDHLFALRPELEDLYWFDERVRAAIDDGLASGKGKDRTLAEAVVILARE